MLKTVRDACQPHRMAFDYAMSNQIEDLEQLIKGEADGKAFFEKTYITAGMSRLFEMGLERLAGRSDQAVFELTQAMGGGKTHTMVAFGLLAQNDPLRKTVAPELYAKNRFTKATVVALSGRNQPKHFLWGEVAHQLGKRSDFKEYWQDGARAPDKGAWKNLLGEASVLILLDELPPFFDYAVTQPVGAGNLAKVATYALSNLFAAALDLPRVCIVLSNLSGAYEGASKDLRKAIKDLEQEARRQAKPITPVELASDEIYQILKKRLFAKLPTDAVVEEVAHEYSKAIREAEKAKSISKSQEQIADEIRRSYPFHPAIKDIIALFRNNESYRQTRGLMQFVSKMIRSVWHRKTNDAFLIGLQHLDLRDGEVRDELLHINDLRGAIATDICAGGAAHAEVIDAHDGSGGDAATQVATLLLAASLSNAVDAVKGMTEQHLLSCLIAPQRPAHEFKEAFVALRSEAWYLHCDVRNSAYYFSNVENLQKRLIGEAERAPQNKIDGAMKERLEGIFAGCTKHAYGQALAQPEIDQVKLNGPRVLLILSPDAKNPPEVARRYYEAVVEKNNFCVLTGDGSDMADLEKCTRALWAIRKLQDELGDGSVHFRELEERYGRAQLDLFATIQSTFNRLYYPTKKGLVPASLSMQYTQNDFNGEEQIVKALAATGVSKLVLDVEKEADAQITKAEEVLWPENQKKVPWKDLRSRALQNPRWTWLRGNGLDTLRKIAESKGIWRDLLDGYLERGPFAKPKTSVSIQPITEADPATGRITLQVTAVGAGKTPQIYFDRSPKVSAKSERLTDPKLDTDATRLYFIAVDPKREHETGESVPWTNKLIITHQPKEKGCMRLVALKVVPRGTIRYTLTGANPTEGEMYKAPFEIGDEAVTVYCHAEDDGVTEKRTFEIPPIGQKGITIKTDKPATLTEHLPTAGTGESFALLRELNDRRAHLGPLKVDVGQGTKSVGIRFGSECRLSSAQVEDLIHAARVALGEGGAEVRLNITGGIFFDFGVDLQDFAAGYAIELTPENVEQ
jgi:hypothetical protein